MTLRSTMSSLSCTVNERGRFTLYSGSEEAATLQGRGSIVNNEVRCIGPPPSTVQESDPRVLRPTTSRLSFEANNSSAAAAATPISEKRSMTCGNWPLAKAINGSCKACFSRLFYGLRTFSA